MCMVLLVTHSIQYQHFMRVKCMFSRINLSCFNNWRYCFICRYKKLLSSVDLTNDFFYSYTYPIMQSLQKNVLSMGEEGIPYDNMFVWNAFLTQAIRSRCKNTIWTIALVHGNFKQVGSFS